MNLEGNSLDLYQSFSSLGYDILNINDPFYNDICTTFTSKDHTDIILSDRRRAYYNENIILCENGCEYLSYDSNNNLVRCKCFVKRNIDDEIKKISFEKENLSYFFDIKQERFNQELWSVYITINHFSLYYNYDYILHKL